jgi:hypothetical protein
VKRAGNPESPGVPLTSEREGIDRTESTFIGFDILEHHCRDLDLQMLDTA